jgi:nitrilase
MKVAAVQMVSGMDSTANLGRALGLVEQAAEQGADLVLLPEYFCLLSQRDEDKLAIAEVPGTGPLQSALSEAAARLNIWLIAGTLPLRHPDPQRVWNTTLVFGPDGRQMARYDKIHLFRFTRGTETYDEARTIGAGAHAVVADCGGLKVGLSVCYDLRFPELYRLLGEQAGGALDLIVVPAAFTYVTGQAHWEILLKARAIENQCYVLAAAQGGQHANGRRTWGHSMLIDPWGEVSDVLAQGEGLVIGQIDPQRMKSVRQSLPALQHRVFHGEHSSP